jgi:hypothetical protein
MWSFVGKKQRNVKRHETPVKGDQYRLCRYGWNAEGHRWLARWQA